MPSTLSSALTLSLLPVAAGIAILRYRLYDIDRLINRTLVYGVLTAILGLVLRGRSWSSGRCSAGSAGIRRAGWSPPRPWPWPRCSDRPAAASRQAVDRRFNRRKYNAAKTIEAFSTRLRDEIDLDTLTSELLAVVDQTMEPTQASLWLRSSPPGSSGTPPSQARPATMGLLSS